MVRQIGDRDDEVRMLIELSRVEIARGNLEAARESANAAHAIADQLRNCEGSALAVLQVACVDFASGGCTCGHCEGGGRGGRSGTTRIE